MAGPMTTMPGMGPGAPLDAMMALSGRQPMFNADPGPRYTGPFNLNMGGEGGMLLQMLLPSLLQGFMGADRMPAQFNPEQNLYDQMTANRYYGASQQAMAMASRRDAGAIEDVLGGVTKMMTGTELTEMQTARNFRMAEGIAQYMPILSQIMGPDLIDRLHGSRGSATVFAQQFHQAMRTSIDPVTGFAGYEGESAGRVSQNVFENLFGRGADLSAMRGMSAGQAGMAINELQARGMMGRPMGMMGLAEQRAMLPSELSDDVVSRIVEELPDIKAVLAAGGTPTEDMLNRGRQQIRGTNALLKDPNVDLSMDDLKDLPGGEEIIRASDAERIASRLKNLSGAVKAMRDIFGDMGNPNAPMREIINGLEALTQGGLATMSPGELEMMVRRTQTIAGQTGVGVQGLLAMASQNAGLADQLGLDRTFAMRAAQQSALFGSAAGDELRLDMPVWGALSKEQLTLADTQLRMHAAASPLANQMNAIARMSDTGMASPAEDTELASIIQAVKSGQSTYDFGGETRDIVMPRQRLIEILNRDAGVTSSEAMAVIKDTTGNQEFGQRYNTEGNVRRIQAKETASRMLTPKLSNQFRGMLEQEGIDDLMQAGGIVDNTGEFRQMMDQIGAGVSEDFLQLTPEELRTPEKRRAALGGAFKKRLTDSVRTRMPGANEAEVEEAVATLIDQMGGEDAMTSMGTAIYASVNSAAKDHPLFRSAVGMHDLLSLPAMDQADARGRQADADAIMQSAFSGLGTSGPIRRVVDALQKATPDTSWQDLLSDTLGGVNVHEIAAADPNGTVARMMNLAQSTAQLDPNDPAQFAELQRNAGVLRGLVEGGDIAKEQVRMLEASRRPVEVAEATEQQREDALERLDAAETRDRRVRDARQKLEGQVLERLDDRLDSDEVLDQQGAANIVRGKMITALGDEEVAIGGNRFLTSRGVVTKNAAGEVTDTSSYTNPEAAREGLTYLQDRHRKLAEEAKAADKTAMTRDEAKLLKAAKDRGLLLGELGYGDERLLKQLRLASDGQSGFETLNELGYVMGAKVSEDQIAATVDSGTLATKMLKEKASEETKSAVETFVLGSRERGRQLLEDERSMEQLGQGGLGLVQGIRDSSRTLQGMAQEHDVSVEALLRGEGVAGDIQQQAMTHYETMQANWKEIKRRREYGMLPGKGRDPENRDRQEMTEQEKEDLEAHREFSKQFTSAEQRANDVVDRMISLATPEQAARMKVDVNREKLVAAVTEGDRGSLMDRALRGRQEIMEMAIRKGVFGDKTSVDELTEDEQLGALQKLQNMDLSATEMTDLQRMERAAKPLQGFGIQGMDASEITQDALRRIRQFQGAQVEGSKDDQDKEMKVTLSGGNITIREDNTADLALEGHGLLNQLGNVLGMT